MSVLGLVADVDDDGNKASAPNREPGEYVNNQRVRNNHRADVEPEPYDYGRPKGNPYEFGSGNEDFDLILKAAALSDGEFIHSLASQIETRGSLTDKQLVSGVKQAFKIVNGE